MKIPSMLLIGIFLSFCYAGDYIIFMHFHNHRL